jgi:hypothetical protein
MFLAVGCGGVTDGAVSDASAGIGGAVSDGGAGIGGSGTGGLGTGGLGTGGLGTGGQRAQGCALLVGQMDGSYLFALSLVTGGNASNKDRPILYLNTVTTTAGIGALNVKWGLQPLRWEDRKTPTGSPLTFSFTLSGGGSADLDLPPLDVPADANPLSGSPITLDIASLNGPSCDVASFYCGTTDGDVTKPIPLSIDGSTWTMERIVGGAYPEPPKIDCAKNLAQELPP